MSSLSTGRNVNIYFNDAVGQDIVDQTAQIAMTADAYKAVIKRVEDLEEKHAKVPQTNFTDQAAVLTGATPYKVYSFTVTADFANAIYTFIFVEEAPNVESLS